MKKPREGGKAYWGRDYPEDRKDLGGESKQKGLQRMDGGPGTIVWKSDLRKKKKHLKENFRKHCSIL